MNNKLEETNLMIKKLEENMSREDILQKRLPELWEKQEVEDND